MEMASSFTSSVELASPSFSSVEMVDLTQDLTSNTMDTGVLNYKQQARRGLNRAQVICAKENMTAEQSKGSKDRSLVINAKDNVGALPGGLQESGLQERSLVISAAARKKILEMALGQSVSTFSTYLAFHGGWKSF